MDLTQSLEARSDQLNADDLISGPRTFTISEVRRGDAEQPVNIVLAEFPAKRPFKPSKTVIRILAYAWGKETDDWPENPRVTLYRDAAVKWAGQEIGGIRISHLSHIDKRIKVALAESKGKKTLHVIDPLPADTPVTPPIDERTVARVAKLRAEWKDADPERRKVIEAEVSRAEGTQKASPAEPQEPNRRGRMFALFSERPDLGGAGRADEDRAKRLAYVATAIGREVESSNDLSESELEDVISSLEADELTAKDPGPRDPWGGT